METLDTLFSMMLRALTDLVELITTEGNELMLIPIGVFVVGGAIGFGKRLIGR